MRNAVATPGWGARSCCLFALGALAGCYTAEGSGDIALRAFPLEGFTEVALTGAGEATIVPGDYRVTASADSDLLPTVRAELHGDRLILSRDVDWIDGVRPTMPIDYRISMPMLVVAETSGSGSLRVRDVAGHADLRLAIVGAGRIDLAGAAVNDVTVDVDGSGIVSVDALAARSLRVTIAGSGHVAAHGSVDHAAVELVGGGQFRGSRLRTATAAVQITGVGQAIVWPLERLDARVNGAGRVLYLGDPVVEHIVQGQGQVVAAAQ